VDFLKKLTTLAKTSKYKWIVIFLAITRTQTSQSGDKPADIELYGLLTFTTSDLGSFGLVSNHRLN
jgi:hypothetical protein